EHRLPHEEVAEVDQRVDVRVRTLLERQLDVATDRAPVAESRALVPCFHDARTRTGHDRETRLGQESRRLLRSHVLRIIRTNARRPEHSDRFVHRRERVESFYELGHDSQQAPRICPREVARWLTRALRAQQLFVFGDERRDVVANGLVDRTLVDDLDRARLSAPLQLRWWYPARLEMTLFRALAKSLARSLLGHGHLVHIGFLTRCRCYGGAFLSRFGS